MSHLKPLELFGFAKRRWSGEVCIVIRWNTSAKLKPNYRGLQRATPLCESAGDGVPFVTLRQGHPCEKKDLMPVGKSAGDRARKRSWGSVAGSSVPKGIEPKKATGNALFEKNGVRGVLYKGKQRDLVSQSCSRATL